MAVYQESAQNAAQMAEEALTSSFRNAGDALVSFAASGKLNFRGLIDSMIADLARFSARAAMSQVFGAIGSALGFGGVSDAVGALGGAASAAVGSNAYGFHLATGGAVYRFGTPIATTGGPTRCALLPKRRLPCASLCFPTSRRWIMGSGCRCSTSAVN